MYVRISWREALVEIVQYLPITNTDQLLKNDVDDLKKMSPLTVLANELEWE